MMQMQMQMQMQTRLVATNESWSGRRMASPEPNYGATETTHVKKIEGICGGGHTGSLACRSNLLFFRTSTQQKKAKLDVSEDVFAQTCQSFK